MLLPGESPGPPHGLYRETPTGMKYWLPALLAFSHIPGWERGVPPSALVRVEVEAPQSTFAGGRGTTAFFCGDCPEQLLIKVFCLAGPPLSWSFGQRERAGFLLGLLLSVPLGVSGFSSTPFGFFLGPQGSSSVFCLPSELLCVFPHKSKCSVIINGRSKEKLIYLIYFSEAKSQIYI